MAQHRILPFLKGETMTLDYAVCPHCGCRCEDDEFCAACGKLFHEDTVLAHKVTFLGHVGKSLRSLSKSIHPAENGEFEIEEDLEFDPSWSCLSSNVHNRNR